MALPPIFGNIPQAYTNESECGLSAPLKALILVVSAVAGAAFGLLLTGITGFAIGAFAGAGAGFGAVHFISGPTTRSLKDSSITWIMGTQSPRLAMMLAVHRHGKAIDLANAPALIPSEILMERGIVSFTGEGYSPFHGPTELDCSPRIEGTHKDAPDRAINDAMIPVESFDLNKTLQKAYVLPGDSGEKGFFIDLYLDELKLSIFRVLQGGITDEEKTDLRNHIQNYLLPIFASGDALREYLYPKIGQAYDSRLSFDDLFSDDICTHLDLKANALLDLFERIEKLSLNLAERSLIEEPCPLVFASTNLAGREPYVWRCVITGDQKPDDRRIITAPALLGRDLQFVYTTAENIDRIRAAVMPFGVEVRDIASLV